MRDFQVRESKNVKAKRFFSFRKILLLAGIAALVLCVMASPVFEIKTVVVDGASAVKKSEITEKFSVFSINNYLNYFMVGVKRAEDEINKIPYIKSADVVKKLPNYIYVSVIERKPRGYVEYGNMGTFLLIDETGMVLDAHTYTVEKLPIITGVKFKSFVIGEKIQADNVENFNIVTTLSQLLEAYEIKDVVKVDVNDKDHITLYLSLLEIDLGSDEDLFEKINVLKEILKIRTSNERGFLDITNASEGGVFRPMR